MGASNAMSARFHAYLMTFFVTMQVFKRSYRLAYFLVVGSRMLSVRDRE